MSNYIYEGSDWNFDTIQRLADECAIIAEEELGLNIYPNQFEIITSTQMLDAYASIGMPVGYNHWSYGKVFVEEETNYRQGKRGLAYELVINSDPCINYLMEENSATVQALVIAHAGFGHNHFFKNNYLFKEWTQADAIINYLLFAKKYIARCEERYGYERVERALDCAHSLRMQGIDRYKKPPRLSITEEKDRQEERIKYQESQVNVLWDKSLRSDIKDSDLPKKYPSEPEENVLKFIEKNSPTLETWEREIIRIVRMISQYFYPQRQTKVMNEGFACWTHCYIMNRLYEKDLITEGAMLEFKDVHSSVVYQGPWNRSAGFNPYALGLEMFWDIERICKEPTDEDREWFPDIAGEDYLEVIKDAVVNYRDESFIRQFLSPHLMRKMRMFRISDDTDEDFYTVTNIHNRDGYRKIRQALASSYEVGNQDPNIQVVDSNIRDSRILELVHHVHRGKLLEEEDAMDCIFNLKALWGFDVVLKCIDEEGKELDSYSTIIELDPALI